VKELRRAVADERVLDAVAAVPRDRFVPEYMLEEAWDNAPLPIGCGQTISQPLVVARMCELLELDGSERVLDVGTGSGYHAALLARLAAEVYSVELHAALSDRAARALAAVGAHVTLAVGDGCRGLPAHAPYDAIMVTAAAPSVPMELVEQLANGGRLVVPVGAGAIQSLRVIRRDDEGKLSITDRGGVVFVPLVGERGFRGQA